MELHGYFRSSASYRVRIALALKGLPFDHRPVHLVRGEQGQPGFLALNPTGLVPLLVDGDRRIGQSLAICEYLEETVPEPPLLPADPAGRARVRSLAYDVACEIHPLNNLRVLRHLTGVLGLDEAAKTAWIRHWVEQGLAAVERRLTGEAGTGLCCHGDTPTLADLTLVPQVYNAERFACRLDHVPTVWRIVEHCRGLPAFRAAHPDACPDAA